MVKQVESLNRFYGLKINKLYAGHLSVKFKFIKNKVLKKSILKNLLINPEKSISDAINLLELSKKNFVRCKKQKLIGTLKT